MDVIQGTPKPNQRRRWWRQRPDLRVLGTLEPKPAPRSGDDAFVVAVVGSLCLQALFFAMRVGSIPLQ